MEIKFSNRVNAKAVFATKKYEEHDIIHMLDGPVKNNPDKYSVEIGINQHIMDAYGMYMQHSFQPTTKIIGKTILALININSGDELTFNYNDNAANYTKSLVTE